MAWVLSCLFSGLLGLQDNKLRPAPFFMSLYDQNKDFFSKPYHLTDEQKKQPLKVIQEFFDNTRLHEARETIASLLKVALTTDNDEFAEPDQRASLMFFCQQLEELIEAAFILKPKEKKR